MTAKFESPSLSLKQNSATERQYMERLEALWDKNWPESLARKPYYPLGKVPLTTYLRHWAKTVPDKPCLIFYGTELSYSRLDELSDRFASYLRLKGIKKGDRVAVFLPNCPQYYIAFFGILKLGAVYVPVSPMARGNELLYELNDSGAEVILALDQLLPLLLEVKTETVLREILVTAIADFLPEEPTLSVPPTLPVSSCH